METKRTLPALLLTLAVFFTGCRPDSPRSPVLVPGSEFVIAYTSVRGGQPQIVDSFIIASESAITSPADDSVDCFVVPRSAEPEFSVKLNALLERHGWATLKSRPTTLQDTPFRRLSLDLGQESQFVEFHEFPPSLASLSDPEFARFFQLVAELRLLGETHSVWRKASGLPAAETLGFSKLR